MSKDNQFLKLSKIFHKAGDQLEILGNLKNEDARLKEFPKFEKILEKLNQMTPSSRPTKRK